jgi:hypothetical protein
MASPDLRESLSRCAERILCLRAGELSLPPTGQPVARLGEVLARRNLGLVRVADVEQFAWPGHWIGVTQRGDAPPSAVVLFGVPSAIIETAGGEPPPADARLLDGYLIAPLDLHRPHDTTAYGAASGSGTVAGLYTAADREAPCRPHEQCRVIAGRGLEGDRYATGQGTFSSGERRGQDLTLIEQEALDAQQADTGITLAPADARRNVVTRGIRLEPLIGSVFTIGDVRCYAARLAEPCAHLQRLTSSGVLRGLVHRGGIRVDLLTSGVIRVGDAIRLEQTTPVDRPDT